MCCRVVKSVSLTKIPITLYTCCTGNLWTMPYTLNGESGTSSVFKISKVKIEMFDHMLVSGDVIYSARNDYFFDRK